MNIGSIASSYVSFAVSNSLQPLHRTDVVQERPSLKTNSIADAASLVPRTLNVNSAPESAAIEERPGAAKATGEPEQKPGQLQDEAADSKPEAARAESLEQRRDDQQISLLAARDREVRAHEQAHAAVGGLYAGAPRYQFERGPDGVNYAVGGEVSIDVSPAASPEETIQKMQIVRRAALAPAEPSGQDRRVAAQASRIETEAKRDLSAELAIRASGDTAGGDTSSASNSNDDSSSSEQPIRASVDTRESAFVQQSQLTQRIQAQTGLISSRRGLFIDRVS